jgi:hypothetical protein
MFAQMILKVMPMFSLLLSSRSGPSELVIIVLWLCLNNVAVLIHAMCAVQATITNSQP